MRLDFTHWTVDEDEQSQDGGQPPGTGAGAGRSRGSSRRSGTHARAWGDAAILRRRLFWDEEVEGQRGSLWLIQQTGSRDAPSHRLTVSRWFCPQQWNVPSWSARILSSSWTEQQEEQEERWASGDTLVVLRVVLGVGGAGASLLLSCTVERGVERGREGGRGTITGVRVTRHLWK